MRKRLWSRSSVPTGTTGTQQGSEGPPGDGSGREGGRLDGGGRLPPVGQPRREGIQGPVRESQIIYVGHFHLTFQLPVCSGIHFLDSGRGKRPLQKREAGQMGPSLSCTAATGQMHCCRPCSTSLRCKSLTLSASVAQRSGQLRSSLLTETSSACW